jgi:hypothetical protein
MTLERERPTYYRVSSSAIYSKLRSRLHFQNYVFDIYKYVRPDSYCVSDIPETLLNFQIVRNYLYKFGLYFSLFYIFFFAILLYFGS